MALAVPFSAEASPIPKIIPNNSEQTPQPPSDAFKYQEYLPTTYCISRSAPISHVNQGNVLKVLRQEMLVPKLNRIHEYLWWCAKAPTALPLHEQVMDKTEIVITEQVDLHLVCPTRRTFIKPLPKYLLCHEFWTDYLCNDAELHKCCVGFLLSYVWRIRHESDLTLAVMHHLVPGELTWKAWSLMVSSLMSYIEARGGALSCVNKRYLYGELELPRLNIVSRYAPEVAGLRGYVHGYGQASMFFKRNFAFMGLGFLYLVAILTAMQVGLATDQLRDNASFNWASYVFAVFCILLPVTIVAVLFLRHIVFFLLFSGRMMRRTKMGTGETKQTA